MIRTLRKRFIIAAMISVLAVVLGMLVPVNMMSYLRLIRDADLIIEHIEENRGSLQEWENDRRRSFRRKKNDIWGWGITPETPYESRFFYAVIDSQGNVTEMNTERIAAVDPETAEAFAKEAAVKAGSGFQGDYRFAVKRAETETHVIFLDCGRSLSSFHNLMMVSVGVAAVGMGAVLLLLLAVSGRIVKPFVESAAKQKQFITDAGHELKTPLTVINADVDLVELEAGESEWLDDIRKQTQRLTELTRDLIYLSKMDEEQPAIQMIEFPISDVVEETAQAFQSLARQQGKTLTIVVTPMLSFTGGEKDIRQLVSILMDNALKYSPAESEIRVRFSQEGRNLRLDVENTSALPIDKDSLNRLFDRFYRMDASRNSETGGYGLGLSIARGIVTAHKGKIRTECPDGKQLTITVLLPTSAE